MDHRLVYFDLETTGVRPKKDRIVEIAFFDPIREKKESWLVNPETPIPKEASSIHKITDEMVKDSPSFNDIGKQFIEQLEGDVVLIAHNGDAFDRPFLEAEFERVGLTSPKWEYIDSLKWARKYRPDLPSHSLQYLRESFEIPANQAHRALDDVFILYEVFTRLIDDLSPKTILELIKEPLDVTRMPFGKYRGRLLQDVPADYIRWLDENDAFSKPSNKDLQKGFQKLGLLMESNT